MNMSSSKPAKRYELKAPNPKLRLPDGHFVHCIASEDHVQVVGKILTLWPWLEEAMISVMASLLGPDMPTAPARQVFRSVVSSKARITILRSLLEKSPQNTSKSTFYDEVIGEFSSLNKARNHYAHGLWLTKLDGETRVYLYETSDEAHFMFSATPRHVSLREIEMVANRISELIRRIMLEINQEHNSSSLP